MRKGRTVLATWVLMGIAALSGGCVDAVRQGIADGINSGLSTVVQGLVESLLGNLPVEE